MSINEKCMSQLAAIEQLLTAFFENMLGRPLNLDQSLQHQLHLDDLAWVALVNKINAAPQFQAKMLSITADEMRQARTIADIAVAMFASGKRRSDRRITFDSMVVERPDSAEEFDLKVDAEISVWYGTNRRLLTSENNVSVYSSQRSDSVKYGTCRVFIPKSHKIGSTGSGFFRRLIMMTDDRLKLLSTDELSADAYWAALAGKMESAALDDRYAVVFIHGYRVTFEEAALRAAQIGIDLSIKGVMAFFSWPSKGTVMGYLADEASIEASEAAITEFLTGFAERSNAKAIHIIAHSMGNRALLRAVDRMGAMAQRESGVKFDQIILAAPDVDVSIFRQLSKAYADLARRTTLYISSRDLPVDLSYWLHQFARVGFAPPVFVTQGIDTVNVTGVDVTMLGHSYFAEARDLLQDIHNLISTGSPPNKRFGLRERRAGTQTF
jgi:esterase/lipase superfamily enzyme